MNKKIYKVTQTQLSSLQSNGFITVNGVRYDYDPNSLYILADPFSPEYRLETQGHNLHLLKDNVIISDLTVPFAQASVYASNAKNLQNKTGSKAYTYYDILPRVDYKDFLSINDLPMEGILCGISRNGYFYKVREEGTNTDIPFTLFCQTVDGYYSLSTSEITTPIEVYTIHDYFNEAKFIPYGTVKKVNNTEPDANGNVQLNIPTVNNGRLIIKKNGTNQAIFTANQSGDTTADIWVPMKTSELTNDIKFVKNEDILLPLSQLSNVRIANLDDALWCADKRFYVIASVHPITVNGVTYPHTDTSKAVTDDNYIVDSIPTEIYNSIDNANIISNLFDGSTDTGFNRYVSSDNYIKIRILPIPDRQDNYSPSGSSAFFSHYPYGGFVLTTYYGMGASNVKYACYNKWESQGVGWKFHDCVNVGPKDGSVVTWKIDDEGNYQRTVIDFWFIGTGDTTKRLSPTSIYWLKYRPTDINDENSYFSKYVNQELVNDVTWKQRGVTTAKISATGSANFKSITEDGQTLTSKYLMAGAKAADSAKLNGQPSSHYLTSIKMNGITKTSTNSTIDLGTVITDTANLVPYTGATKDIDIGTHSFTMSSIFTVGSESSVYTRTTPGSISLKNPIGTLSIGTYSLSVNGTTIYWPTVSADPNGKYFALKSDIPANIKDGTGNGSLNQIKDGTGTTFSIDDSSGNSKNPNAYALDNTIKGDIVFGGVGDYSTSLGGKSSAQGKRSVAQGTTTIAKGNYSHAEGDNSVALGPDSHAEGYATVTYGKASHSEGTSTQAIGEGSHAEGSNTKATKTGSHSEGEETNASGYASHTEGLFNKVLSEIPADTGGSGSGITPPPSTGWNIEEHRGDAGHAEGYGNVVYGFASHAEGHQNKSSGHYSHSEGLLNTASGNYSHAEGIGCLASDTGAHAGGSYCYAITSNAFAHGQSLTTNIPNQTVFGEYNLDLPFSSRETQYLFAIGNGTDVNNRSNAFVSYKDGRAAIGKDPVNDLDVATKKYVDGKTGKLYKHLITLNNENRDVCQLVWVTPNNLECKSVADLRTILGNPMMDSFVAGNPNGDVFCVVVSTYAAQFKKVGATSLSNITTVYDRVAQL